MNNSPTKEKATPARAAFKRKMRSHISRKRLDYNQIKADALHHLPYLLSMTSIHSRADAHELKMLNPHRQDRSFGSFSINVRTGKWADFAERGASGGDVISLFRYLLSVEYYEAAAWIHRTLGRAGR